MSTKLDPSEPNFIFNAPVEDFSFYGADDAEKARNAVIFSSLRNIGQRYWQQFTRDELEAIKISMRNCIVEE